MLWQMIAYRTMFSLLLHPVGMRVWVCVGGDGGGGGGRGGKDPYRILTRKAPITTVADDLHKFIFIVFQRK